jgi:AraC-like DNA-binding protein
LDDSDALIPCDSLEQLIRRAMGQRFIPNIGARLASLIPIGTYALLDYLILTCDTVAEGTRQLVRYFPLVRAPADLTLVEGEDPIRLVVQSTDQFTMEFSVSLLVHHFRRETEGRLHVDFVSFVHAPNDVAALAQLLGCTVCAPAAWCGVALPRQSWRLPLRRRDPMLRNVLEGHARDIAARERITGDSTVSRVRSVVASTLGRSEPTISDAARRLNFSSRTLQRRLAAEGMSFQQVVDDMRRDMAERLLADASLAVAEISYVLGFSEPSAFHRAFKRWSGVTPMEFREERRGVDPSLLRSSR